jgi:hypothetical protein
MVAIAAAAPFSPVLRAPDRAEQALDVDGQKDAILALER